MQDLSLLIPICRENNFTIINSTCSNSKVIVSDVFNATMQTDPIKLQKKTITAVVVVLLMGLSLCAEAGSK